MSTNPGPAEGGKAVIRWRLLLTEALKFLGDLVSEKYICPPVEAEVLLFSERDKQRNVR